MTINKNASVIPIIFWILIALLYISHTPYDHRTHDVHGHIEYSEFIVRQGRLPFPTERFHAYYPPLYYAIASSIIPNALKSDNFEERLIHINCIRCLSIVYGAITLWIIGIALQEFNLSPFLRLILLLFIGTTPKYVFIFSTYNNDSLLTMLSIGTLVLSYKLCKNWSRKLALCLLITATASLYTKYNALFCMLPISFLCLTGVLFKNSSSRNQKKILIIMLMSFVLFVPWIYFHNYLSTGKLFPTNQDGNFNLIPSLENVKESFSSVLKIPILQYSPKEWSKPWVYPILDQSANDISPATKSYDYLSFNFITSIIGEFTFTRPGEFLIWTIIVIHLLMILISLTQIFRSNLTMLSAAFILLSHLMYLGAVIARAKLPIWGCAMDFRYLSFTWVAGAVLYASAIADRKIWQPIIYRILLIGIIVQVVILMTVEGARGWAI